MNMATIYRVEIYAYQGNEDETTAVPMSDFYLNKEDAEKTLEHIKRLTLNELNNELEKVGAYMVKWKFGLDKPYIEKYNLLD